VVVGGGIGGLTTALLLAREVPGVRVTVLDAGDRPGGKLRLEEVAGHRVDVGAEAVLALRPEAVDLVESIGAGAELVTPVTTAASVWSRGALHPLPRATLMGVPADPESTRGILTGAEVERLEHEAEWPGGRVTEDVSVGDYVGARLGPAVVDRLVEPLLGGVYAGHARRLSLRATMPAVWQVATTGGSLAALAARAVGPRPAAGAASPAAATPPAAGTSPAHRRPPFAGLAGGVGRLPGLVLRALEPYDVLVRSGTIVRALERTATGWAVVAGPTTSPERIEADAVVLTVGPAPTARLLAGHAPSAAGILREMETASSAVVTLAVRSAGLGPLPGSGFLVPPVDGHVIKASTFSASKWAWTAALSDEVTFLRASIGRAGEERDLQREDGELVEVAVREVGEALGRPLTPVVDAHVQRWGGGLPQYVVGHVDRVAAVRADVDRLPGLELAGAAYDGVGIPAVVASATGAAHAVAAHVRSTLAGAGEWGP
jgi:oxygen-dependent protoporphyrinogen oxidase